MKAIQRLMDEHQVILKALNALEIYASSVQQGSETNHRDFEEFGRFIKEFADDCHHGKEEDILFESMIDHGFSKEAGPLAVMYHDHDLGREQVKIMREVGQSDSASVEESQKAAIAGLTFVELLRGHIHKEDNILYPMASQQIAEHIMDAMDGQFDEFEGNKFGLDRINALGELGKGLMAKY